MSFKPQKPAVLLLRQLFLSTGKNLNDQSALAFSNWANYLMKSMGSN